MTIGSPDQPDRRVTIVTVAKTAGVSPATAVSCRCTVRPLVPLPTFADAYETQRVLEAVTLSAKTRSPVKIARSPSIS